MRRPTFIPIEMRQLGSYLRHLRQEFGMSIRGATRRLEMAPSYLSKLEAGDTFKSINVYVLLRLSKCYKIPVTSLLKESGLLDHYEDPLPDFPKYLREKYQFSPQAIRDMEMAKEIVDKKYPKFSDQIRRKKF